VLKTRITKLQKRIDRAQSQLQDAERHIAGYLRESGLRDAEAEAGEN
jgi:DNA-binding MurR/RpiR family transcriptional regulator